jgi:predicted  nucleic acid-binding Zn-ribbon protein
MESVETQVVGFLVDQKASALREAIALKAKDVLEDVLMRLGIILQSLQMPLSELEQKLQTLEEELSNAERQRTVAGDLLAGDQRRLEGSLETEAEHLREESQASMDGIIHDRVSTLRKDQLNITTLQNTLAATIPGFFEKKLGEITQAFNRRLEGMFDDHQRRANKLIETVRRTAADLFHVVYEPASHAEGLEAGRPAYWVAREWNSSFSPVPADWFGRLLPLTLRRSRLERSMSEQATLLVRRNVENLRWSILQNMDESFRGFRARLDQQLDETIGSIRQAIELAQRRRHDQSESISNEVTRLQTAQTSLNAIREKLSFVRLKG